MNVPTTQFSMSDKGFGPGGLLDNLRAIRSHGFTHLHLSHAWTRPGPMTKAEIDEWQSTLAEADVQVLDVHGCHHDGFNIWEADPEARERGEALFRHRLEVTAALGGDAMVYHVPCHVDPAPEVIERFVESLARLEEHARELGVIVALENHFELENDRRAFSACFERFSPDYIRVTLDPGHGLISGNLDWLLDNVCDRLFVLHLNENDRESDRHWSPFHANGIADWTRIANAIAKSPYAKPVQLEVFWHRQLFPEHRDFLTDAAAAAERLATMVNATGS